MVVGAYTIINTLGLLIGLPYTTTQAPTEISIDINHNFTDYILNYYCENNVLNQNLFKQNSCVLINSNDVHYYSHNFDITTEDVFSYQDTIINYTVYYTFHSKIDDYLVFTVNDIVDEGNDHSFFYAELTQEENQDEIYTFNQIYLGVLTSSLSSINGDSVIGSITSGLGLMDDITKQFGSGFGALIWDSTKNQLTIFGNFALIFLGVSITFSIVKLCLSLIRSKTGS